MQLNVRVVEAKDIEVMDFFGSVDPYVLLQLDQSKVEKTKVKKDDLTPQWNEEFSFPLTSDNGSFHILMRDEDFGSSDDDIGRLDIPIPSLTLGQVIDRWYKLIPAKGLKKAAQLRLVIHLGMSSDDKFLQKGPSVVPQPTPLINPQQPVPPRPQPMPQPYPQQPIPQPYPQQPIPQPYPQQPMPQPYPQQPMPQPYPQQPMPQPIPQQPSYEPPRGTPFFICSQQNPNLVLDIEGGTTQAGAHLIVWPHHGGANQQFTYDGQSIRSVSSGRVIDISGSETQGQQIIIWDSNRQPNQTWTFHPDGTIRSPSGLCLDIKGGNSAQGTKVISWQHTGGLNQKWLIRRL